MNSPLIREALQNPFHPIFKHIKIGMSSSTTYSKFNEPSQGRLGEVKCDTFQEIIIPKEISTEGHLNFSCCFFFLRKKKTHNMSIMEPN